MKSFNLRFACSVETSWLKTMETAISNSSKAPGTRTPCGLILSVRGVGVPDCDPYQKEFLSLEMTGRTCDKEDVSHFQRQGFLFSSKATLTEENDEPRGKNRM